VISLFCFFVRVLLFLGVQRGEKNKLTELSRSLTARTSRKLYFVWLWRDDG